jgi:hypothetical protein
MIKRRGDEASEKRDQILIEGGESKKIEMRNLEVVVLKIKNILLKEG